MRQPFYHANPNQLELETTIVDSRPGRVVLEQSPFFLGVEGSFLILESSCIEAVRSRSRASSMIRSVSGTFSPTLHWNSQMT